MKVPDIAASAMLRPPEAEPVMPASAVTVTASLISGLGMAARVSRMARKPGRAAMTAPKPYSEAVLRAASREPATAALLPSANPEATGFQAKANTARMPASSASSTAQIAVTCVVVVTIGLSRPASIVSTFSP